MFLPQYSWYLWKMSAVGFGQIALVKLLFPSAHFAKKMGKCTKVESCGGKTRRATFLTVAFEKMHWRWAILWMVSRRAPWFNLRRPWWKQAFIDDCIFKNSFWLLAKTFLNISCWVSQWLWNLFRQKLMYTKESWGKHARKSSDAKKLLQKTRFSHAASRQALFIRLLRCLRYDFIPFILSYFLE